MTLGKACHLSTEKGGPCKARQNGTRSRQAKPRGLACGSWERSGVWKEATLPACLRPVLDAGSHSSS